MPGLKVQEIEDAFICTVVDLGNQGWDPYYGWGLIQIKASLELLKAGLLQKPWWVSEQLVLTSEGSGKVKVAWEDADDCNGIDSYIIQVAGQNSAKVVDPANSVEFTFSESGTYEFTAIAKNVYGNLSTTLTNSIEIDLTPLLGQRMPPLPYLKMVKILDTHGVKQLILTLFLDINF